MNDHIQYQTMMLGAFGGPDGLGSCGNKNFRKALKKGEVSVMNVAILKIIVPLWSPKVMFGECFSD